MTIVDLNEMEARVDIVLIKLGQKAQLEVDAFRDRKFNGTVTEIANAARDCRPVPSVDNTRRHASVSAPTIAIDLPGPAAFDGVGVLWLFHSRRPRACLRTGRCLLMPRRFSLLLERGFLRHWMRLLRVRDKSERVAPGFALGLVINFFPTFGFGFLISGALARLVGGNFVAGLVGGGGVADLCLAGVILLKHSGGQLVCGAASPG